MVDMGFINFYPRLKVERNKEKQTIKLSYQAYIEKVFNQLYLNKAYAAKISMKKSAILQLCTKSQAITAKKERYQGIIGSIIFSIIKTRPDIAFTTPVVAQFAKNRGHQYIKAVKSILWYLKGFKERNITFSG